MTDNNINNWLEQARQAGLSDTEIQKQLESTGWTREQINQLYRPAQTPNSTIETANTLIGISEQFNQTLDIFKKRWKTLVSINALSFIIPLIISIIPFLALIASVPFFNTAAASDITSTLNIKEPSMLTNILLWSGGLLIFNLIIPVIIFLVQTFLQSSLLAAVVDQKNNFKASLKTGWHRMWSMLWINFLTAVITMLPFIIMQFIWVYYILIVGMTSISVDAAGSTGQSAVAWVISLLSLLSFLWMVASITYLGYAQFFLYTQDQRGLKALKASFNLIKGYFWQVLGRHALLMVFVILATVISVITIIGPFVIMLIAFPVVLLFSFILFSNIYHLKQVSGK